MSEEIASITNIESILNYANLASVDSGLNHELINYEQVKKESGLS